MKIVIDARMCNESGIGRYIRNLISNLQIIDDKNEYFILHLQNNLKYRGNFHKINANFKWYGLTEQIKLPGLLKSIKPDLVHFPHFNVPLLYRGKFVVTIHDLIHQHFSMQRATSHGLLIYKLKQLGYKQVFKNALKNSQKILVPSNFVKGQLMENYNINREKIIVTPEAMDDKLYLRSDLTRSDLAKTSYIFYVGNAHPHKNVEGLIKAFLILKERNKNLKLILAGADHYFWQRIKKEFKDKDIIYTGYISDEKLAEFYRHAQCFVMPSFEEGYGIPILEAFAFSCPVVSSNAGSLPEVGGDAVIYFNPKDQSDMIQKISNVLDNKKLRQDLVKNGLQRIKLFSWKKLTKQTLEIYQICV